MVCLKWILTNFSTILHSQFYYFFCCQKNKTPSSTLHSSFYNRYTRNISYVCKCICITNKIFIKSTELQTNIQKIQKYSLVFLIAIGFHTWKIIIINTIISVVEFLVTNNLVTNKLASNKIVKLPNY